MDNAAVVMAVKCFEQKVATNSKYRAKTDVIKSECEVAVEKHPAAFSARCIGKLSMTIR